MISNRVKRNAWGILSICDIGVIIARIIDVLTGGEWWQLASAVIIYGCCMKFFWDYNKAVKNDRNGPQHNTPQSDRKHKRPE